MKTKDPEVTHVTMTLYESINQSVNQSVSLLALPNYAVQNNDTKHRTVWC